MRRSDMRSRNHQEPKFKHVRLHIQNPSSTTHILYLWEALMSHWRVCSAACLDISAYQRDSDSVNSRKFTFTNPHHPLLPGRGETYKAKVIGCWLCVGVRWRCNTLVCANTCVRVCLVCLYLFMRVCVSVCLVDSELYHTNTRMQPNRA